MSIPYDPPHHSSNFIFNEFDYNNVIIITSNNEVIDFLQKSGDIIFIIISIINI